MKILNNYKKKKIYSMFYIFSKNFLWLLLPSCLIIFTLLWQSFYKNDKGKLRIGIVQFVEHEALDAVRNGFIDVLSDFEDIKIDYKNAQGDQSNCTLISNLFVANDYDLILAIATPAAQAAAAVTSKIPIIAAAITSHEEAGIVKSNLEPNTNVTGTSDIPVIDLQIKLIKKLKPEVKKIAILYSNSEVNSKYQSDVAFEESKKIGIDAQKFTFSQMSEIQPIIESMIALNGVDAIYTPTDNMVASNMPFITKIASNFNVPVICSEGNLIEKGAAGTYGMDYYELGKLSASQAIKILVDGMMPQKMSVEYLKKPKLILNNDVIKKLKLKEVQ